MRWRLDVACAVKLSVLAAALAACDDDRVPGQAGEPTQIEEEPSADTRRDAAVTSVSDGSRGTEEERAPDDAPAAPLGDAGREAAPAPDGGRSAAPPDDDDERLSTDASAASPGDAGPGGEVASSDGGTERCRGGEQVDLSLVGWAAEAGGTTGGKGGSVVTVRDGAALAQALKDKAKQDAPLTLLVEGTITAASAGVSKFDVKDVRNVSILGAGQGAVLDGIGIKIVRSSNVVVRNLKISNVATGDKDAISIEGPADHIWIDHCELHAELDGVDKDHYDGLLDVKGESEYITYSWNYLHDSWKTSLVGSSESDTFDRKLTMHHNHYERCNSRMPLFRGGQGHLFNNFYDDVRDTGINSRIGACLRIENNFFQRTKNPWVSAYSDELGAVDLACNLTNDSSFAYAEDVREPLRCTAKVPYDYSRALNAPERVPELVRMHAGVGKLKDPTDF